MGANSRLFLENSEQVLTMYEPTFTKKDAILTGKRMVDNVIEEGEVSAKEVWTNIIRLKEFANSADAEFRCRIDFFEKEQINGILFTPIGGGNTVNYSEDEIYCQLKADLDARVELLKLAQKQPIIDAYGNDVPKVGTTPRKDIVQTKF